MKVLIAGGRDFKDFSLLENTLDNLKTSRWIPKDIEIISGCARGADTLGELYAKKSGHKLHLFPADWDTQGRKAGILRNIEMGEVADVGVIFWDGESKGTKHMIGLLNKANKPLTVITY